MKRCSWLMMIVAVAATIPLLATRSAVSGTVSNAAKGRALAARIAASIADNAWHSQIVSFADRGAPRVRIVRGTGGTASVRRGTIEIVGFADSRKTAVRVVRGGGGLSAAALAHDTPVPAPPKSHGKGEMLVAFADPQQPTVTVLRGMRFPTPAVELFAPASSLDLDRVAFAVDGAESSHGTDPRMWRPEFAGPQGPMQVSAAAAFDIGGGDRFEPDANRLLGRAYLARLFRRYGNWSDAIAAYNWGPGNLDAWIGGGRSAGRLPLEVERYRDRVLHEIGLQTPPTPPDER